MALSTTSRFNFRRFFRQQQLYVFVAVALFALISVLGLSTRLWTVLVFSLCIGNLTAPIMTRLKPYYARLAFPINWLVYLPLLAVVGFGSTILATAVLYWLILDPSLRVREKMLTDIRFGTLITVIFGIGYYLYGSMREKLEKQNVSLQQALRTGEARIEEQEKELETAREIQAGLMPKQMPQFQDLEISASWQPARAVGGDYFDVIKQSDHRVTICIADVVGKGIAAALLMANVQAAVRAFATDGARPSEVCDRLNRVLCSNLAPGKFVTFLCCVVDMQTGILTYSNAGHCFPLLARGASSVVTFKDGGLVLGVEPEARYSDSAISLQPNDKILFFTDGIAEVTNALGEEFGEPRLRKALAELTNSDVEAIQSKLMQEVSLFCDGNFTDDATLVLLAYKQSSGAIAS